MEDVAERYADHHFDRDDPSWKEAYADCIEDRFEGFELEDWLIRHTKPSDWKRLEVERFQASMPKNIPPDKWPEPGDEYHIGIQRYRWFSSKRCIDMDPEYGHRSRNL